MNTSDLNQGDLKMAVAATYACAVEIIRSPGDYLREEVEEAATYVLAMRGAPSEDAHLASHLLTVGGIRTRRM